MATYAYQSIFYLLLLFCHFNVYCKGDATETCNEEVCEVSTETLGQKLLRKQTEFYHLTTPVYASGSSAIGIKFHNPNNEVYDMYWFDPRRSKGN